MEKSPSILNVKAKEDVDPSEDLKQNTINESFHQAVGPALFFGQFFGMLPVDGILSRKEEDLKFRWRSPRTIYSVFFLFCGSIETAVATRRLVRLGFNIHFAEAFLFYITAMVRSFFIFQMGMKWNLIIKKWRELENVFLYEPYKLIKGWKLSTQIRVVFGFLMTLVIVEHLFFLVKAIEDNRLQITHCTPKSMDFWQNYLWRYRPHLIYNFPYSPFELPLYEWVNFLQAMSWSYSDIFIIVLAIGIKFRFNQFNQYFRVVSDDVNLMSEDIFRTLRVDYYKLIELVHFIDSKVATLILMSLGHNMLVLIIKIFSALVPNRYHYLDDIYFWFYLIFLITRIFATLIACASIHDTARHTVFYIRKIPSDFWTIDLKRLFDTISVESETLTFSGQNYFYVTKNMILTLAGTIITYELVLLDRVKEDSANMCSIIDY
ncbi:hypothetical protein PVAND_009336 [Polypedilum vanderplanki]|uniref:Gustatory receptor n=1 Tax=Polypedilum vanderplanki TaxID=319348 RepID=A0A9J6CDS8_POLVA|nr:hypothetical protein PVAND_009336 [Polypedilum vanderplanki]